MEKDKKQHVLGVFLINPLNQRIKKPHKLKLLQWFIHIVLESDKRIKKNFDVEDSKEYSQI